MAANGDEHSTRAILHVPFLRPSVTGNPEQEDPPGQDGGAKEGRRSGTQPCCTSIRELHVFSLPLEAVMASSRITSDETAGPQGYEPARTKCRAVAAHAPGPRLGAHSRGAPPHVGRDIDSPGRNVEKQRKKLYCDSYCKSY